ncbi:MAG: GNAT family N-acetyltransferase [Simkaniaceae bacterium]|nr:GNAT family N-acetyltransferase [Candidatus Sacchlamyda saccharinae]
MITESKDYDIRYSTVQDMDALRSWFKTDGMLHWYPPVNDQELENFVRVWIGFTRYNACLTATYQGKPVGMAVLFLMPYRKVAHHAMFQIIVDPEFQRKGVGHSLIRNLKHLGKNFKLELIHAEVLDVGPLIPLLEKLEFKEFARQEKYVKEEGKYYPRIMMECILGD